jgi:carboxyl-terminal processing protease
MMTINKRNLAIGATTMLLAATAVLASGSHLSKSVALLKSNPKEVVEEVWQIVNFSYVDGTFNKKDWNAIRKKYVTKANYKTDAEAYKGVREMLKTLGDPYTQFLDKKEYRDMQLDTAGNLIGVGIQLTQDPKTKQLVVVSPIEDTPAAKAGIISKDVIIKIDDKSTKGMDVNKAVSLIRGQENTTVVLTIKQGNQTIRHKLLRQKIEIHPVKAEYRPNDLGGIGYIRLNQFSANAPDEMSAAIRKMEAKNVNGYVLDLRGNPGGLLYGAIDIARMWLNKGTIVSTRNRAGGCDGRSADCKQAADGSALTNKPLVVLVDGGSASASEILSGALQDNKRAQLVGSKTFGKGLVQAVRPLRDGSGLKVTIAKYFTPSGKDINKLGIKPDVNVPLSKKDIKALMQDRKRLATKQDPQYSKALITLQGQIANRSKPTAEEPQPQETAAVSQPSPTIEVPASAQ